MVGPYALLALLACERLSKSEPIITIVVVELAFYMIDRAQ